MGDDHSGRSVGVAECIAERTHCGTGTDYNSPSYGREVAGWPLLQRRKMRWYSERVAEHIRYSPESQFRRAGFKCLRQRARIACKIWQ